MKVFGVFACVFVGLCVSFEIHMFVYFVGLLCRFALFISMIDYLFLCSFTDERRSMSNLLCRMREISHV